MSEIVCEAVNKTWITEGGGEVTALKGVDLTVNAHEFVAIIGTSGCGKTTLLNIIAGLEHVTDGRVLFRDEEVTGPSSDRGVVFQTDAIFGWRTVIRNVEYGLEIKGIPREERRRIANEYVKLVGLEGYEQMYPKELSGGMRKRCQIAAVLANDPEVLLMDEPFGALDYATKSVLQSELRSILEERPKTTIFVTHDVEEALLLADRIVVMSQGVVISLMDVPFGKHRDRELLSTRDFAQLKGELWDLLEGDAEGHRVKIAMEQE